jgi:glycerophosphoryl diester phosphodiesterase
MTKIIGHRGAGGLALENSPQSIRAAVALPIDGIELDIRRTKDGNLILLHDPHTGRVANKKLYVSATTLAELQALELTNGERILTLDEALALAGEKPLVLDIKDTGVTEELVRVLAKHPKADITLSSRKYGELKKLHHALPQFPFLAQSHVSPTEVLHLAHQLRATGVSLNKWLLNPLTYHTARRTGLKVYAYTVNHRWLFWLFTKFYPQVTIFTDHPERFINQKS